MRNAKCGRIFTTHDRERLRRILNAEQSGSVIESADLRALRMDLERAKPVDPSNIRPNIVTMHTTFCLKDLGNGKKKNYSLVYPEESVGEDKLSVLSCIGAKIIGCSVGTVIRDGSRGDRYYLIEEIIYQPQEAGVYHT